MDCHRTVKQVDTHEVKVKTRFIEEKMSRPLWVFCKSHDFPKILIGHRTRSQCQNDEGI